MCNLHYVVDTILIGEPTMGNLWTIKAMLRYFELSSSLCVNFVKIYLIRIQLDESFLKMTEGFFNAG